MKSPPPLRVALRLTVLGVLALTGLSLLGPAQGRAAGPAPPRPALPRTCQQLGVNLSAGEFGSTLPGTYGTDYIYPGIDYAGYNNAWELDYFHGKGLNLIRLNVQWERLQHSLNGPLTPFDLDRIRQVLDNAAARNMQVILSPHNFARYQIAGTDYLIGSPQVPYAAFTDFWHKLAAQFVGHPALYAYSLDNEPHDTGGRWVGGGAQAGITGIRLADTVAPIFVPGDGWSGAWSWVANGNDALKNLNDPAANLIFDAHQYFDSDYSGTYAQSYNAQGAYPMLGVDLLSGFVSWLHTNQVRGAVTEYAVPNDDSRWLTVMNNALSYLRQNNDVVLAGAWWSAGPWWGPTYRLSVEPSGTWPAVTDRVQMSTLANYGGCANPGPTATATPTACALPTSQTGLHLDIPDNNLTGASTTLVVPAGAGTISAVNVTGLNITHTWIEDLRLQLTAPDGTVVNLFTNVCTGQQNIANITLDDGAAALIGSVCPPTTNGSYRPTNPLAALTGHPASGTWTLTVIDSGPGDTGYLTAWGLRIAASNVCATATAGPPTATATAGPPTATQTARAGTTTPTANAGTQTAVAATQTATARTGTPLPGTQTAVVGTQTAVAATVTACTIRFSDVTDPSSYYYAGVYYLACRGVISGYSDGTFRPFLDTTRGQMTKIVTLAFNLALIAPPPESTRTFTDVLPANVFYPLIETAAARNIVTGYDCGGINNQTGAAEPCDSSRRPYFRPSNFVTRGQLTKIGVIGAGWTVSNPPVATFNDVNAANVFYPFIETAVCHGVIQGYADRSFRPNAFAFRSQIAKIVYLAVTNPPQTCSP